MSNKKQKNTMQMGYDDGMDYDTMPLAQKHHAPKSSTENTQHVRISTLYMAIGVALVVGFFAGTLMPNAPQHASTPAQKPAPTQAASPTPSPEISGRILALEEAVRTDPNDVQAWIQLGNNYFDIQKNTAAIHAYEHALALQPNNANVLTDLGVMYRNEKQFDKALQAFIQASSVDNTHEQSLFNAGIVLYYDLGKKAEGRAMWEKLLRHNPETRTPSGESLREMLQNIE